MGDFSTKDAHCFMSPYFDEYFAIFLGCARLDDDLCFKIWEANFIYNEFIYYEIRHKH